MCVHTKSGNTSSSGGDVLTCSDLHSRWWSIWGGPSYKEHKICKLSKLKVAIYVCTNTIYIQLFMRHKFCKCSLHEDFMIFHKAFACRNLEDEPFADKVSVITPSVDNDNGFLDDCPLCQL